MNPKQDIANGYGDFLDQWKWDCHITLTWPRKMNKTKAEFQARNFLNKIQKRYKMKLSGTILIKQDMNSIHAHILLLSAHNYPMNLDHIPNYKIQQEWKYNSKITRNTEWTNTQISHYLAKKQNMDLNRPDDWDLHFFRKSNLMKLQNRGQQNG